MNNFYVYMLLDPRKNNTPFYIGKGIGKRAWNHLLNDSHTNDYNPFKTRIIGKIRKNNLEPLVKIYKDNLTEMESRELEIALISLYGRRGLDKNGILSNRHPGGQGGDTSEFFTSETYSKFSKSKQGVNNPRSTLTEQEVIEIYYSHDLTVDIVEKYNISKGIVTGIKTKRFYNSILDNITATPGYHPSLRRIPLSPDTIKEIFYFCGNTKEIKAKFNISVTVARNIKEKKTYKKITNSLENPGIVRVY